MSNPDLGFDPDWNTLNAEAREPDGTDEPDEGES